MGQCMDGAASAGDNVPCSACALQVQLVNSSGTPTQQSNIPISVRTKSAMYRYHGIFFHQINSRAGNGWLGHTCSLPGLFQHRFPNFLISQWSRQDKCQALRPKAWDFWPKQIFPLTRTGPKSMIVPGREVWPRSEDLVLMFLMLMNS